MGRNYNDMPIQCIRKIQIRSTDQVSVRGNSGVDSKSPFGFTILTIGTR